MREISRAVFCFHIKILTAAQRQKRRNNMKNLFIWIGVALIVAGTVIAQFTGIAVANWVELAGFAIGLATCILGIVTKAEKKDWKLYLVWVTFIGTILLWATEQLTHINSNIVALIPLGVFTATGLFGKEEIKEINWNVLWLVAGGFCLGYCLQDTGLAKVLIQSIPFGSMSVVLVLIIAGIVCYFLSNFISNSATAALLIPILIVVAEGMADPAAANNAQFVALGGTQAMIIFIAVCASIAMLFPISTPPNAIASSTGMVESKDMTKVGLVIGAVGFVLGYFWLTKIFPFS